MIANAAAHCTKVRIVCNIGKNLLSRSGCGQDCQELISLERGATDQTAVYIRHCEQLRRITGLDAAAIEDTCGSGNSSITGRNPGADEGVHVLRLLGGGV